MAQSVYLWSGVYPLSLDPLPQFTDQTIEPAEQKCERKTDLIFSFQSPFTFNMSMTKKVILFSSHILLVLWCWYSLR